MTLPKYDYYNISVRLNDHNHHPPRRATLRRYEYLNGVGEQFDWLFNTGATFSETPWSSVWYRANDLMESGEAQTFVPPELVGDEMVNIGVVISYALIDGSSFGHSTVCSWYSWAGGPWEQHMTYHNGSPRPACSVQRLCKLSPSCMRSLLTAPQKRFAVARRARGPGPVESRTAALLPRTTMHASQRVTGRTAIRGFGQEDEMRRQRRYLLPPAVTPAVPHGLQRGGIMQDGSVPPTFIDVARRTVPTDSPLAYEVPQDVFGTPIGFSRADQVIAVTGFGQMAESADPPGLPVQTYRAPVVPHGLTEGGIFGQGHMQNGVTYQNVPQRYPMLAQDTIVVPRAPGLGLNPDGLGGCGCLGR